MQDNSKRMRIVDKDLYFVIDEKNNQIDLTDKGVEYMSQKPKNVLSFNWWRLYLRKIHERCCLLHETVRL